MLKQDVPGERFDVEAVARKLGMSYAGFRKRFVRLGGVSPAKFQMQSVIERACELIHRRGPTNRELAGRLGFCDEFHFSRRFKQIVGLSPREFRQQISRER
jgi:AraC-like DNA-binding protein